VVLSANGQISEHSVRVLKDEWWQERR
jgi:hypothetical protein